VTRDPALHKRFLDYRDRHRYFGGGAPPLDFDAFAKAEEEFRALEALGDARSDEDEVRFAELMTKLHRD
jgi:hypothetical protein